MSGCCPNDKPWFLKCNVGPRGFTGATGPGGATGPIGPTGPAGTASTIQPLTLAQTKWTQFDSTNTANTTSGFPIILPNAIVGAILDVSNSITVDADLINGFISQTQTGADFTSTNGTITYVGAATGTFRVTAYMTVISAGPGADVSANVGPLINGAFVPNGVTIYPIGSNLPSTMGGTTTLMTSLDPNDVISLGLSPLVVPLDGTNAIAVLDTSLQINKIN